MCNIDGYTQINKRINTIPIVEDSTRDDNWFTLEGKILQLSLSTNNNVVTIYNTEGQKVIQQKVRKSAKIDLSALPKGIYAVIVNKSEHFCKFFMY